jgi:predicted nucleic acid-binding protein
VIRPALVDASAWNWFRSPRLPRARADELAEAAPAGRLLVSLPFLLEAGSTARTGTEYVLMLDSLLDLPRLEIDSRAENRALAAQRQLARAGHHRVPPADLIIAALADLNQVAVLHYDRHYDLLAEKTDLEFESIWLAEAGSL